MLQLLSHFLLIFYFFFSCPLGHLVLRIIESFDKILDLHVLVLHLHIHLHYRLHDFSDFLVDLFLHHVLAFIELFHDVRSFCFSIEPPLDDVELVEKRSMHLALDVHFEVCALFSNVI